MITHAPAPAAFRPLRPSPRATRGMITPAGAAQRAGVDALNAGGRVRGQMALARSLNRAPEVSQLAARGAALQAGRPALAGAPVQRMIGWRSTVPAGIAGGAWLGSYLDAFLPYRLGSIGGAALGAGVGALAPGLIRRGLSSSWVSQGTRTKAFWNEINQEGRGARTIHSPASLADQLAGQSAAFGRLRERARTAVRGEYGRELSYASRSQGYAGSYGNGQVGIDTGYHPVVPLANVVFETANAAQTRFFQQVRDDYDSREILRKGIGDYAGLLGREAGEMDELRAEYETDHGDPRTNAITRRVLLQEWGEYNSLALARGALRDVRDGLTGDTARDEFDRAQWNDLIGYETFGDYYRERGVDHRRSVEAALRRAADV